MESVFFNNMPEATVNRTNRKTKKNTKNKDSEETLAETFPSGFCFFVCFFFCFFFGCFLFFFVFFVFLLNCAKNFLVELWADKWMQKVDSILGGGRAYIYILYIYISSYICLAPEACYAERGENGGAVAVDCLDQPT